MRVDPLRSARPGERLPGEVSFPARLMRPLRTAVITGVLLLAGSLALALFQESAQAWFAVAAAVTLAVAISVILAMRGLCCCRGKD